MSDLSNLTVSVSAKCVRLWIPRTIVRIPGRWVRRVLARLLLRFAGADVTVGDGRPTRIRMRNDMNLIPGWEWDVPEDAKSGYRIDAKP